MAEHLLDAWGFTYDSEPHDTLTLIVAELCANAAQHGRVPGRDFHLRLSLTPVGTDAAATVRVEVTDTRTEKLPALTPPTGPRGLGPRPPPRLPPVRHLGPPPPPRRARQDGLGPMHPSYAHRSHRWKRRASPAAVVSRRR
ncbi:hypothetical protein ACWD01_03310 [Streptomyces sp. NPDC002835]